MEPDFRLLARAFNRARALHRFYLTAWVFLPDHWALYRRTAVPGDDFWGTWGLARVSVFVHLRAPRLLAMARFVGYHGPHEQDDRNDLSERVYPTSR